MMLVGVIEESAKALPLALYIYKKPYFNEITDGVFYFGIVGITFSVIESIFYTLQYGAGVGIGRLILTPFLHTGFSMWFGYTLARYKLHTGGIHLVIIAFVSSMLLHGMYNFGMSSGMPGYFIFSLIIAIALNIGVFLLYRHAQDEDVSINIASNNSNNFCRSCGKPNTKHTLFCESCGQHT
jgi:RsiW-degrading membrane proteinase PrsW (M82 family)